LAFAAIEKRRVANRPTLAGAVQGLEFALVDKQRAVRRRARLVRTHIAELFLHPRRSTPLKGVLGYRKPYGFRMGPHAIPGPRELGQLFSTLRVQWLSLCSIQRIA
jgi:hypothetical protein